MTEPGNKITVRPTMQQPGQAGGTLSNITKCLAMTDHQYQETNIAYVLSLESLFLFLCV